MSGPLALVRPELRGFEAYEAAVSRRDAVRLHANEACWRHDWDEAGLNRYPDTRQDGLAVGLAALYGVPPAEVLVTRGSDDAIDVLVRSLCRAGRDAVVVCPPTFGMYAVAARVQGAALRAAPLDAHRGWALDPEAVVAAADGARLVFLCSPNNPTGNAVPAADIARVADALAGRALVVVDEAYGEFADTPSALTLRPDHPNLAVLRTLSKAYGLAGARLGALVADPELAGLLRAVLPPYLLPTPCTAAATRLLEPGSLAKARAGIAAVRERRATLARELAGLPAVERVWPSEANFLLVRFVPGAEPVAACAERGLLIRDFSGKPALARCARITVGAPEENRRLLTALAELAP